MSVTPTNKQPASAPTRIRFGLTRPWRCMYLILASFMLAISTSAWGAQLQYESPTRITQAVQSYLNQHFTLNDATRFQVEGIDPRLRLHHCDQPLSVRNNASTPPRGGHVTVQVACHGSHPWHIFVPAQIEQMVRVVRLNRPLPAGARIKANDLGWARIDANQQTRDYLTDPATAVGRVADRPMQAGHILSRLELGVAQVVKRGDHVVIQAGAGGLAVTTGGVAQSGAGIGQRVQVKNLRTGKVLQGIVRDRQTVSVIN